MNAQNTSNPLAGRTLYIPEMTYAGARAIAAAFHSIGVDARISPTSDDETLELGGRYTSGEECLPEKVTLGDFLKVVHQEGFDANKTAFLLPTANGPCRYGQYRQLLEKVLRDIGHDDVFIFSPTSADGYDGFGENSQTFVRTAWRALVIGDILTKALLRTRPYELRKGDTDEVFEHSLRRMCGLLEKPYSGAGEQMEHFVQAMSICHQEFETIPADYTEPKPLIGVVGEIFCRMNDFSNSSVIRKLEEYGCEAWLSDVAEWVWYTNDEQLVNMKTDGKGPLHPDRLKAWVKRAFQRHDEHQLYAPFEDYFVGYEEPEEITEVLEYARPYLPKEGALGEMVLSTGKTVYLYHKGADGIVDISPFTCMNGIVTEAIYPKVSADCDHIPIRTFYFDGITSDLDRDVGIFAELVRTYKNRKRKARVWPHRRETQPAMA